MLAGELGDFLDLALAEQGRRPDLAQPECLARDDLDADRLGKPLRLVEPRLGWSGECPSPTGSGTTSDRALAARDVVDRDRRRSRAGLLCRLAMRRRG